VKRLNGMPRLLLLTSYLCLLPAVMGGQCQQPKGQDGDRLTTGCIVLTCKSGAWRPSLDPMVCCYNGEPFQFGSTITVVNSADNCVTTSLECGEKGIKTRIDIRREETGCSGPATHEQVRQIKCMLKQHLAESGNSGCNAESLKQEKAPSTPPSDQVSGILITGGEGPEAVTTELFIVENKKICSLPSLPSPRFGHTLDVMEGMPIVCGGYQDEISDNIHSHSCLNFIPLSDCGSWQNLTTLQYEYGFGYHPSWVSPHGLVLFGTALYNVMELLPVAGPAKTQFLEYDHGKRLEGMEIGGGSCGFDDGGVFILTGNTIYGHGKTVTRFSLEMFDKPGHCSWADDEYCCMNEDYERCRLSKGNVEKLPDLQQTRGKHGCGMYRDKNDAKERIYFCFFTCLVWSV